MQLDVAKVLLAVVLAFVGLAMCNALCQDQLLYPYGPIAGDISMSDGDDGNSGSVSLPSSFPFFGGSHSTAYVNINGHVSFDSGLSTFIPSMSARSPPYVAPFWTDIVLNWPGVMYWRVTSDPTMLSRVQADAALIGGSIIPTYALIATWKTVLPWGGGLPGEDTFQVVLFTDGTQSFALFHYGVIVWQFNWGTNAVCAVNNGVSIAHCTPISGTSEMINIAQYSNVNIPGKVVIRIDPSSISDIPVEIPSGANPGQGDCFISATGNVQTFDGVILAINGSEKVTIAKSSETETTDPCRFRVVVKPDANGAVDWVAMSVGAHPWKSTHMINYAFNRVDDGVEERGVGVKAHVISMPYEWASEDGATRIKITGTYDGGWDLISDTCPYCLSVDLNGSVGSAVRVGTGSMFAGAMLGMCQNGDSDATNDYLTCQGEDVSDAADANQRIYNSCS